MFFPRLRNRATRILVRPYSMPRSRKYAGTVYNLRSGKYLLPYTCNARRKVGHHKTTVRCIYFYSAARVSSSKGSDERKEETNEKFPPPLPSSLPSFRSLTLHHSRVHIAAIQAHLSISVFLLSPSKESSLSGLKNNPKARIA